MNHQAETKRKTAKDALDLAGAWSDLDWDEMETALYRIRHESVPTPPIDFDDSFAPAEPTVENAMFDLTVRLSRTLISPSAAETAELGERIGRQLRAGDVILLHGDLGAGKTTLAQGIAAGLGIVGEVQSPTFTLVHEHDGVTATGEPVRLYHLDLYRLGGEADLDSFGFEDYLAPADGVTLIEWPERAGGRLPPAFLLIRLEWLGADERRVVIEAVPAGGTLAERFGRLR